jgi:HD-GYP domain-containing protein (c-di-GMP phosphodiesterase class II)
MAEAVPVHLLTDSLRIKQVEQQISAPRISVIRAFNQLLDLKDLHTGVHSTRLAEWGMPVGQELGFGEAELGGFAHPAS